MRRSHLPQKRLKSQLFLDSIGEHRATKEPSGSLRHERFLDSIGKYRAIKEPSGLLRSKRFLEDRKAQAEGFKCIAGVDEAGRGPLAGPVVASAVVLKDFDFTVRIDDSKKLSQLQREAAYTQILEKAHIGIGIVPEDIVDSVNIHNASIMAMERSVLDLDIVPGLLLIDGCTRLRLGYSQITIVKGDQRSLAIACASIIAKVTRDRLLSYYDTIFPGYGFNRHKGYGTKEHRTIIKEKGFSPIHRRSFTVRS
ncbi:MAG: ribonuclease HII [Candidatus Omnitrophica bacterium]|nr:ribonuclease HII [Candidatus Omnitrophota bacterium]